MLTRYKLLGTAMACYEVVLFWSREDQVFIADVPELLDCAADDTSRQKALTWAEIVIAEWIETAQELGHAIPSPRPTRLKQPSSYDAMLLIG